MSQPAAPAAPLVNPILHPGLHAATDDHHCGHCSFLDVVFDASLAYDGIRTSILQGLSTANFDNLRQASRSIDYCLTMPSFSGRLRYPPHLIDKCDEFGFLPNRGSCPNPPQSTLRTEACQYFSYDELRPHHPHRMVTRHPREHLVCEVCRRDWHDNVGNDPRNGTPIPTKPHDLWRTTLAKAHITVCGRCDREQKQKYSPTGHDGCVCYREKYKKRWLCHRCDLFNLACVNNARRTYTRRRPRRNLQQVGDHMQVLPVPPGPANLPSFLDWCPCGREVSERTPLVASLPGPWLGNHHWITPAYNQATGVWKQTTKQCVLCCGYIVPPDPHARQPTRRSARLDDRKLKMQKERKHTMLDRSGKTASKNGVSLHGFEKRGKGGRS